MSVYYVSSPEFPLRAKVDAPSTDKARTVYLDYLERNGTVPRRFRQEMRKGIATKRLTDSENITADVELDYEYGDMSQAPIVDSIPQIAGETPQLATPEPLPQEQPQQRSNPLVGSPIARLMLSSVGVK